MHVIDYDMPYEQFLAAFEGIHAEWIDGVVYQLPRQSQLHRATQTTLCQIFTEYLGNNPIGQHVTAPTLLRVNDRSPARCPDLQVILNTSDCLQHSRAISGPADIVVEIVSEFNHTWERGDKFIEYEQGGVGEYWIIDPIRQECLFYALDTRYFRRQDTDAQGVYHSKRLKDFKLPVSCLWSSPSEDTIQKLMKTN